MMHSTVKVSTIFALPDASMEQNWVIIYECGDDLSGYIVKEEANYGFETVHLRVAQSSLILDRLRFKSSLPVQATAPDGRVFFGNLTIGVGEHALLVPAKALCVLHIESCEEMGNEAGINLLT